MIVRVQLLAVFLTFGLMVYATPGIAALGMGAASRFQGVPEGPIEPSNEIAPVPTIEATPTQVVTAIPALPQSLACDAKSAQGLWRLQNVYEEPAGYEVSNFHITPVQYLHLRANGTFGRLNGSNEEMKPKDIIDAIRGHATNLLQYLVQETGLIYFYQDKVANDVQSCFIVAIAQGAFNEGDMLLMPPKGQIKGRLVKQYRKVGARPRAESKFNNRLPYNNYRYGNPPSSGEPGNNAPAAAPDYSQ